MGAVPHREPPLEASVPLIRKPLGNAICNYQGNGGHVRSGLELEHFEQLFQQSALEIETARDNERGSIGT